MRASLFGLLLTFGSMTNIGCMKQQPVDRRPYRETAARVEQPASSAADNDVDAIMARMREKARNHPLAPGEKKFLWDYSGQTPDELFAMEADHRVDSLVLVFEKALDERKARRTLSQVELDVLTIEAMEREVNNGGFHQFFLNSSREYAPRLPAACERIGCPITARIASDALAYLQINGDATPKKISEALSKASNRSISDLGQLDKRYFEYREKIADSLFAYLKANKSEIRLP